MLSDNNICKIRKKRILLVLRETLCKLLYFFTEIKKEKIVAYVSCDFCSLESRFMNYMWSIEVLTHSNISKREVCRENYAGLKPVNSDLVFRTKVLGAWQTYLIIFTCSVISNK